MQHIIHRAAERGTKDIGWLVSKFSFSFSSYQNPIKGGFGLLKTFNDDIVKPTWVALVCTRMLIWRSSV